MKSQILVLVRETIDQSPSVRLNPDGYSIDERGLRRMTNPSDLCALEMALRIGKQLKAQVDVLAIGPRHMHDHLRAALSLGAHRAIHIDNGHIEHPGDAHAQAILLARAFAIMEPWIIATGDQIADSDTLATPALAAARLGIPCATAVIDAHSHAEGCDILRKSERGARQRLACSGPCMIQCTQDSCEISTPDQHALMASLQANIIEWNLDDLGIQPNQVGESGSRLSNGPCNFPRPNPRRTTTPDPTLPAFERILALLSGGIKTRAGVVHQLSADQTVDKLMDIFREEGLLEDIST